MHPPILETRHETWPDEAACAARAQALAAVSSLRDAFVELQGPLGAGKTTFTRHLLRALGIAGRIKSPSYAVVEPYELAGGSAWHFDFYRFGDEREWEDAGFREIFAGPGLKLVEWAQNAGETLPVPDLRLELEPREGDARAVRLDAYTERGRQLLRALPTAPAARLAS
jgi:tRNA threonylcarbamoyladenosine biosynthesis protein TsaE